jgi:hypothetical protein
MRTAKFDFLLNGLRLEDFAEVLHAHMAGPT